MFNHICLHISASPPTHSTTDPPIKKTRTSTKKRPLNDHITLQINRKAGIVRWHFPTKKKASFTIPSNSLLLYIVSTEKQFQSPQRSLLPQEQQISFVHAFSCSYLSMLYSPSTLCLVLLLLSKPLLLTFPT